MNVVPYIDVMLVLLVIFMVTAPLINPGQVELPSVGSKLSAPVQPLEVTLRNDQSLWLRDAATGAPPVRVSRDDLVARLRSAAGRTTGPGRRDRRGPRGALRGRAWRAGSSAAQRLAARRAARATARVTLRW